MKIIQQISQKIEKWFRETAYEVGVITKYMKRKSKMSGDKFLQTLVFGFLENPNASLSVLSDVAEDLGVPISSQGIHNRMTADAVAFMKAMYEQIKEKFQPQLKVEVGLINQFKQVHLLDSTVINLPASQKEENPGVGGSASPASLKIQTMWDQVTGQLKTWWQTGKEPDSKFNDFLSEIGSEALFLADLGYFKLDTFVQIAKLGSYFITRSQHQVGMLRSDGTRLDIWDYLANSTATKESLSIKLGVHTQIPCRLIAEKLAESVVAERRRKAKATAKKKGRPLSQAHLKRLEWSVLLTNVPSTMLSDSQVIYFYTLRWQIELLFKLWKSEAHLDRIAGVATPRIFCELYAKLIGLLLFNYLVHPYQWQDGHEISLTKAFHLFQRQMHAFQSAFRQHLSLVDILTDLGQRWLKRCFKEKRQGHLHTFSYLAAQYPPAADIVLPDDTALVDSFFALVATIAAV